MTVKLSMADMREEPRMPRTTFPYPSAGRPSRISNLPQFHGCDSMEEHDELHGTFQGMTESEFFGGDVGDKG